MRHDRHQIVSRVDSGLDLSIESGLFDRKTGLVSDLLRQREVFVGVSASRFGHRQTQHSQDLAVKYEWGQNRTRRADLNKDFAVRGVRDSVAQKFGGHVPALGLCSFNRGSDPLGNALASRGPHQAVENLLLPGVGMVGNDFPDGTPFLDQIDGAEVGNVRNHQLGNGVERRLVVDRLRQKRPCFGQKLEPRVLARLDLAEARDFHRDAHAVGQHFSKDLILLGELPTVPLVGKIQVCSGVPLIANRHSEEARHRRVMGRESRKRCRARAGHAAESAGRRESTAPSSPTPLGKRPIAAA